MRETFRTQEAGDMASRLERFAMAGGEGARLASASEIRRRGKRRRTRHRAGGALLAVAIAGALIQGPALLPDSNPSTGRGTTLPPSTVATVPSTSAPTVTTTTRPEQTTTTVPDTNVTVRPSRITAGQRITISVRGCKPGVEVAVNYGGAHDAVWLGKANADGSATKTLTQNFGPGKFPLIRGCDGNYFGDADQTPFMLTVLPENGSAWLNINADAPDYLAGERMHIDGGLCPPGSMVVVRVDGKRIGTATADADGFFEAEPRIPRDVVPGTYRLDASCGGVRMPRSEEFSVSKP
jgi:hypothetical protein